MKTSEQKNSILLDPWTWLRRAFHAKTFHTLERVPDLPVKIPASFGKFYEPFAWWDSQAYCWRTWQRSLIEDYPLFSGRWPRSGMTRNGIAYRRDTLVLRTDVTVSGLWPTPQRDEQPRQESRCGALGRMGREQQSVPWDSSCEDALAKFRRMDDGLPRSVASTDGYRNAVIPQIPEMIGRAMLEAERDA